uniref:C-type lectin domain-containing protein n=1 Tax=Oryzias latipes TaxID=8090 RepID=A0A3P9IBT9_ORYLA
MLFANVSVLKANRLHPPPPPPPPDRLLSCHFCLFKCQLHEYYYVDKTMNWTGAQQHCKKEYTDLATVSTMADMERLREIHSDNIEIWIGLFNLTGTNVASHWSLPGLQFNKSQVKWKGGNQMVAISCEYSTHFLCYNGNQKTCFSLAGKCVAKFNSKYLI